MNLGQDALALVSFGCRAFGVGLGRSVVGAWRGRIENTL